jgi:steroid 5-alpha reductase family enzyme
LTAVSPYLEIVTAVIIAILIPIYRKALLGLGSLLGTIGVVLALLGFGLWVGADALIVQNEHIGLWAAVLAFYSAVFAALASLHWHLERRARRAAPPPDAQRMG